MTQRRPGRLASLGVPDLNGLLPIPCEQPCAGRIKEYRTDFALLLERADDRLHGCTLPDQNRLVGTGGGETLAVRRKHSAARDITMTHAVSDFGSRGHIPEPCEAIYPAPGHEPLPIG